MLPTIRKILYASDLGDSAARVFAYAVTLARQHGASITFVHAVEPMGPTAQSLVRNIVPQDQLNALQEQGLARVRDEIKRRVDRFCESELEPEAAAEQIVDDIRIVDGHPADVIGEQAHDVGADLIIMGTHGRHGLQRALLGSVAQKIVARAHCPVLLVPIPEDVK